MASEEANWSGSALFVTSMWIFIKNQDQVIWLDENYKRAGHLNLFSMARVNTEVKADGGSSVYVCIYAFQHSFVFIAPFAHGSIVNHPKPILSIYAQTRV